MLEIAAFLPNSFVPADLSIICTVYWLCYKYAKCIGFISFIRNDIIITECNLITNEFVDVIYTFIFKYYEILFPSTDRSACMMAFSSMSR